MLLFDYFILTLNIYVRNNFQQILEHANILHSDTYDINKTITTIETSLVGVEPQLKCTNEILVEIRLYLKKTLFPSMSSAIGQQESTSLVLCM